MKVFYDIIAQVIDVLKVRFRIPERYQDCCDRITFLWDYFNLEPHYNHILNKYFTLQNRILIVIILFFFIIYYARKKASKILRLPGFLLRWQKKGHYKYHVILNSYMYGGPTNERKYDREAFGIEEQIFQQCVPVRALNKCAERKYNTIEDANYEKLKSYSTKYDLPFRERYT